MPKQLESLIWPPNHCVNGKNNHERGELKASLGISKLTVDRQRIRELERELAIAKMERDILKKATAFFTKESK